MIQSLPQLNSRLHYVWIFNFHNVNKETKERGPDQTIAVCVRWIKSKSGVSRYQTTSMMRDEAVKKFTDIVEFMYPRADQIVSDYGPVQAGIGRVFV